MCPLLTSSGSDTLNDVIGLLLPPEEPDAAEIRDGALLAIERANQLGTNQARLVIRGRVGQWGADGVEAGRMAIEDGAAALIAPPSGAATHLALQVAGRTAIPVVSLCPDSSVSQTGVPWMVRIVPSTVQEAEALFTGLKSNGPPAARRWFAVVPDGRPGREITRDLKTAVSATGCSLDQILAVGTPPTNLLAISAKIISRHPDVVLVWLDPALAADLVKALRKDGFAGLLAGPGRLCSEQFAGTAGKAIEGFVVPTIASDPAGTALHDSFEAAWQKRFGHPSSPTARFSYDATMLLLHLLQRADRQPLHRSFPLRLRFPGVSGELSFDEQGNRIVSLQLVAAHHGRFGTAAK